MIKPFNKTLKTSMKACFLDEGKCEDCMYGDMNYPQCMKELIKLSYETMVSLDHRRLLAKRREKEAKEG